MNRAFEFSGRIRSFKYAFVGIWIILKSQHNAWVHAVATIIVFVVGFLLKISTNEWCLIVLAIVAVWTVEALNTAFEFLADATNPDFHPLIKKSKDVAACAVLIAAIGSIIIGVLIFLPKVIVLLNV